MVFNLGGNHNFNDLSTYPYKTLIFNKYALANTKGPIIIEDDVWIGMGATILSGVNIAQGVVIGACTVVTKDVPAYSVVVGNQMRIVKYRLDKELIDLLIENKFLRGWITLLFISIKNFFI